VLRDVRAVPGVRSASLSWSMPFEGNSNVDGYLIDGRPTPPSGNVDQTMQTAASPGFFATAGITLLEGRDFTSEDDSAHTLVAVVNDVIANRYWPHGGALGKRIRVTGDPQWSTIVGVVRSARDMDAAAPPGPHIYASLAQLGGNQLSLGIRTDGDAAAVIPGVRAALTRIEPSIPLERARPLTSYVEQSRASRRLTELLLVGFAALAVILASVGIFGVMSLSVANRSREFGVRLAIGAAPGTLVAHVLREGAVLAAVGVGLGVVLALAATRWIANMLFAVSPTDPAVFATLSLLLGAVAVVACWLPARRAARSDPLVVLRAD
jgi:predicted permease